MLRRILFVAHDSRIHGGANRSLLSIIEKFNDSKKYDVFVLLPKTRGDMIDKLNDLNIKWICFPYHCIVTKRKKGFSGLLRIFKMNLNFVIDYFAAVKLYKILIPYKFDTIYTNTRIIFISGFVAKRLKIPHVIHSREFIKDNMLRTIIGAEKIINSISTKIIVISDIMKKSFELYGDKINLIYNGVPYPPKNINKIFVKKDKYHLLIVGTIIPAKGQLDAVKALGFLKSNGYENFIIHIIGTDPNHGKSDSYKSVLEKEIKKIGITQSVIFHGEIQDMVQFRKDMDIELVCSVFEPFGRVTVEAMQNSLIVIGANSGATPEIIKNGYNGLLYELNNYKDLGQKILMIINNPEYANQLIANAIDFTKTNFTIEKTVQEVYELIDSIL